MVTMKKAQATKILSPESSLIPLLKEEGWVVEGEECGDEPSITDLRQQARDLGLTFHPATGAERLKARIQEALEAK